MSPMSADSGFSPKLLAGKVGLVTGAGTPKGIGRSLVLALAAAGARAVYATDLSLTNIPSLQKEVRESGSSCEVHGEVFDVASEEQTIRILKQVLDKYQRLDFYFANAGVVSFKSLEDTDATWFNRIAAINQRSCFLAIRYAGHGMSVVSPDKPNPGGSIVLTSSMAASTGSVADIAYTTSKAAVSGMVQCASVQLSANFVRVNAMEPGFVKTSIMATSMAALEGEPGQIKSPSEEEVRRVQEASARPDLTSSPYYYARMSEPDEMARIGVFLASDLSAAINGQRILADCGKVAAAFGESVIGPIQPLERL
ncbi:hypothetical protein HIM_09377 [Hirsutella minnesotensis 3608]|uniref:Uncharacterized protein n=1 Tax=Hirsutella minnesotensis 3608 TaxID=1043627 RepID=A0A0F8A354_9HYPO|nr:hypothetical protein HIM_09377 [Hirsutella minnesotensis 3608]